MISDWLNDKTALFWQKSGTEEWIAIDRVDSFDVYWGSGDPRTTSQPATIRFSAGLPDGHYALEIGKLDSLCLGRIVCGPMCLWGEHVKPLVMVHDCKDIQKKMPNMISPSLGTDLLSVSVELVGQLKVVGELI